MKMTKDNDKHCMISMEVGYNEEDHNHQSNNENENEDIVYGLPDNVKKNSRTGKVGRETTCDHGKPTSRRSELQSIIKYKIT